MLGHEESSNYSDYNLIDRLKVPKLAPDKNKYRCYTNIFLCAFIVIVNWLKKEMEVEKENK